MRSITWTAILVLVGLDAAAQPSVNLHVDRTTVQLNTPFTITIEASGRNVEDPEIPDVPGLEIEKYPSSTSSRTQVSINLTRSSVLRVRELGYTAVATRTGRVEVPRIPIRIDGQLLYTRPLHLTVVDTAVPRVVRPSYPMVEQVAGPGRETTGEQKADLTPDKLVFITSEVDKEEVFQGEPVLLQLRLWRLLADGVRIGARRSADFRYPETEGFYVTSSEPRAMRDEREGWPYEVMEYQQRLYPTATGALTIGAWHWEGTAQAQTRRGPRRWQYDLDTQPITITVKPLPQRPAGFSGAVGKFDFQARLSRSEVLQGVPIKLDLSITGQGNPNAIGEPELPRIEKAYVSDPAKKTEPLGDGGSVRKTITYSITPLEPGEMTVPAITFCFFDPGSKKYETLTNGPYAVQVLASAEPDRRVWVGRPVLNRDGSVDVLGEDIRGIVTDPGALRPRSASVPANVAVLMAPMLAYAGLALWVRRERRFERDVGFARDYHAKSRSRKRLKSVEQASDPSEELYRAVIGFIADKFNVSEAGMTSADVQELFSAEGVDNELDMTFTKILRACERARYGTAGLTQDELRALTHAALPAMDALERALKKLDKVGGPKGAGA